MSKVEFATQKALAGVTPKSANVTFAVIFIVTSVLAGFVSGTHLIDEAWKVEVMLMLKAVDALVYGIGRLFGVVTDESDE